MCETKLIVQKSMLILSYSDECGKDHNLTSGTQYHQKNGFRKAANWRGIHITGLEKNRLPRTCLKSILRID